MTYKKIDLEVISKSLNYSSWVEIKKEVNKQTGFEDVTEDEIEKFKKFYPTANVRFGLSNLQHANSFIMNSIHRQLEFREVFFKTIEYTEEAIRFVTTLNEKIGLSCINAFFTCPNCLKQYKIHMQPTRGLTKDTSLCKKCQKEYLHKCNDYRKTYEASMIEKYGVKRPLQAKSIMETHQNTMLERYGVKFSALNPASIEKRDITMIEKYGVKAYWNSKNGKTHSVSNAEKHFIESIECIFEGYTLHSWKTTQKYFGKKEKFCYGYIDFYVDELKLGIEFFGDYYHLNPELYKKDYVNHFGSIAEQRWKADECRNKSAENFLDCKMIVVWEYDWNKRRESVIKRITEIKNERCTNYKL